MVIYLKPTTSPNVFVNQFQTQNTSHRYRVMRIWQEDVNVLLQSPVLFPLAVLAKTDNPESLLSQVAKEINKIENRREKINISTCVQLLAGLKFDLSLINLYFREDIMQESVVYNKILDKGIQQSIQQTKSFEI